MVCLPSVLRLFAAAHRLIGYKGQCEALHGHNFLVETLVSGEKLGDDGLLIDFKILKDHLKNVLDDLDHKYLNEIPFFTEKASSAEYIAMYIFEHIEKLIEQTGVSLKEVRVGNQTKLMPPMNDKTKMADVQNMHDDWEIEIDKVGVKNVKYPMIVLDKVNNTQHTIATIDMYVNLHHYKGTHMSRFVRSSMKIKT